MTPHSLLPVQTPRHAPVAGPAAVIVHRQLAVQAHRRAAHQRPARRDARVIHHVPRRRVVAAVDDHVELAADLLRICGRQAITKEAQRSIRPQLPARLRGRVALVCANAAMRVRDLAVQVVEGHGVLIGDAQGANARGHEVEGARAAESAGADDKRARLAEALLRCRAHSQMHVMGTHW